ncbi:hypothetical protein C8R45DRAFT_1022906 [Mycena sanguinolenta]|nr:hypothetical protein C8R45DRAFT_1022906 [Mycena sanguinolenta]
MAESKPPPNDGAPNPGDDLYNRQKSTLQMLAGVGTLMAGVQSQTLSLILSLGPSTLRTVSLFFAIVAVINTIFTSLYSTVMASLYLKITDQKAKGQGKTRRIRHGAGSADGGRPLKGSCMPSWKFDLWVTSPKSAHIMIVWCGIFLVIGASAGFIALILYFFASSSIGVSIFVVIIVFTMGVFPMIGLLISVREEKHASTPALPEL